MTTSCDTENASLHVPRARRERRAPRIHKSGETLQHLQ
jgi:hypothetical protein